MSNSTVKDRNNPVQNDGIVYEAVLIAESFSDKLCPLSRDIPEALFPLVNQPILEYTLRFLRLSGIRVVYVVCSANAELIQNYIDSSTWSNDSSVQVNVIVLHQCLSLGDVLREMDSKGMIRHDFVLLSSPGIVSNVKLKPLIQAHREQYKNNKQLVMTQLYVEMLPDHELRTHDENICVLIDDSSQRLLFHKKTSKNEADEYPMSIFLENPVVSVRNDLYDCHISICSPQVLSLFSDNFDYQTKDDFIKGMLQDKEVINNIVHAHIIKNEYAAAVSSFYLMDIVSKHIIGRWVHPFTPDNNLLTWPRDCYDYKSGSVYLPSGINLGSFTLESKLIIGLGTTIGNGSNINRSVIGKNCVIGDNVILENAYLWDNVKVENNCCIKFSILANNVHLMENSTIEPGCILSYDVVVGPNVVLKSCTTLTLEKQDDDFGDESIPASIDIGAEGKGFVYTENEKEVKYFRNRVEGLNCDSEVDINSVTTSDIEESDDALEENQLIDDSKLFYNEVLESVLRAVDEKNPCDTLVLEINSSKHAYNITMSELNSLVTTAVMVAPISRVLRTIGNHQEYFECLKPILIQMIPMLRNYMKSIPSQLDCINALEEFFLNHSSFVPSIFKIFQILYDKDVLSEDAILKWNDITTVTTDQVTHDLTRKHVSPFVQWLKEAEEEESD